MPVMDNAMGIHEHWLKACCSHSGKRFSRFVHVEDEPILYGAIRLAREALGH
jgi:hypothetical protein